MLGEAKAIIASNVYYVGNAVDVVDGIWTVSNNYLGSPSLWIIIRRNGEPVADCQMCASTVDGITGLDIPSASTQTRKKVVSLIREWVAKNRPTVYPY